MKRSVTDVIRRGFENTVANWPLLLIRIAEGIVFIIIVVVAVIAAIVPVAMSIGLNKIDLQTVEDPAELFAALLSAYGLVLLYLFALITVLLVVLVAIHSFVEAGCARVYVDAEKVAGAVEAPARNQFAVFSADRWFAGGRQDWWPVFWIYNLAWGVAGLIMLAPLSVVLAVMLLLRDNPALAMGVSCFGLVVSALFIFVVAVVTAIWCQKAIVVCVARLHRATGALGAAWAEFKLDAGRHIGVALILYLLMIVGSLMFASLSAGGSLYDRPAFSIALMPMQLVSSLVNTIFSAAMTSWFLACFAALTVEKR